MRLSLNFDAKEGVCGRCGGTGSVVTFGVVTETHAGDIDPLCQYCLFNHQDGGMSSQVPMEPLVTGRAPMRKQLRKNKRRSKEQEQDIAEELGAHVQPNSGATTGYKGDVRKKGVFRLEAKFTHAESYSVHLEDLHKIAGECTGFEKPVIVIDFLEQGTSILRDRYAILNFDHYKELLNGPGQHR